MQVDPLKDLPGYALRRASAAEMQILALRLSQLGLRPSEASVLMVIDSNRDITQSEIGRMLEVAGANMAPLVGGLKKRKLIVRKPLNGRSHGLALSPSGAALTLRVNEVMKAHEADLMAKIPVAHHTAFLAALHSLWDYGQ